MFFYLAHLSQVRGVEIELQNFHSIFSGGHRSLRAQKRVYLGYIFSIVPYSASFLCRTRWMDAQLLFFFCFSCAPERHRTERLSRTPSSTGSSQDSCSRYAFINGGGERQKVPRKRSCICSEICCLSAMFVVLREKLIRHGGRQGALTHVGVLSLEHSP